MNKETIKAFINDNTLLMDGAMGTYYASITNDEHSLCEWANIYSPHIIEKIHDEYIEAGAKLIRTNTFAANRFNLKKEDPHFLGEHVANVEGDYPLTRATDIEKVNEVIRKGFEIAERCAKDKNVFVACSIGPITEVEDISNQEVMDEYYRIIDIFLNLGANLFVFETFSHTEYIGDFVKYILERNKHAEIIGLFSVSLHGYSKMGISYHRLIENLKKIDGLVAFGFNCGVGPGHLYNLLKNIEFDDHMLAVVPNAGYPEKIMDRTFYMKNSEYFAETMMEILSLNVKILGGCCGTTPEHIRGIYNSLKTFKPKNKQIKQEKSSSKSTLQTKENIFWNKLDKGEFVIAVEIDPPFGYDISKLMEAAHILKASSVDIITIADSPLGRMRLDSIIMSAKIQREVGIDVMPHICCRDKNIIALKAVLSAAYVEGIRNYLLVTGDPLPDTLRSEIKGVFNMNSITLMSLVKEMNEELTDDVFIYGGALNPKGANLDRIIEKAIKKKAAGAKYLLTQPVFTDYEINNIKIIKEKTGLKILGGILPLVSYKNARFINNEFAGMNIPDEVISKFDPTMAREEAENIGIKISVEVAKAMKEVVDGLYFMTPFNRATMIAKILKQI